MKTSSLLLPTLAAATLFIVAFAHADQPANPTPATPNTPTDNARSEWIKRFDTNGDGKLDENEKAAAKAAMHEKHQHRMARMYHHMMKLYDKNGDGRLDEAERTAALADLETRPRFVARFDTDGDGQLNAAEKANAETAMRQHWDKMEAAQLARSGNPTTAPAPGTPATPQAPAVQ